MARIFSISFLHTNKEYSAIVSVQQTPFHTEYRINMLDEELMDVLPSNRIVSSAPGHYVFLNVSSDAYTPLMKEIISAIAHHMQNVYSHS